MASLKQSCLEGYDRVELVKALSRLISHLQAEFYAAVVGVAEAEADFHGFEGYEVAASEVGTALVWTRRAADSQLGLAFDLVGRLPR